MSSALPIATTGTSSFPNTAPNTGVHEGRDGWLFLVGGSNDVADQYRADALTLELQVWRSLLSARAWHCRRLGARYRHLVVPEKLSVYDHKLDGLRINAALSPAARLRQGMPWYGRARRSLVDLVGPFRASRDEADLYLRTDSHWSLDGRLLAYERLCRSLRAEPRQDFRDRWFHEWPLTGDLGVKLNPPQSEPVKNYRLQRDAVRVYASPLVRAFEAERRVQELHVGANVVYRNDSPGVDSRCLVLFGDSYAHFSPIMLTIMLAETFHEVHFVWSTSIDWSYVRRTRPDIVVTEVAERFMRIVPDDQFDLDAYVARRYAEDTGDPEIARRIRALTDEERSFGPADQPLREGRGQ